MESVYSRFKSREEARATDLDAQSIARVEGVGPRGNDGGERAPVYELARVYVTLRPTVNDPQGLTIRGGLHQLGFGEVEQVRAGKYLELRLAAPDAATAEARAAEMCKKLLANPVIEDFRVEVAAE